MAEVAGGIFSEAIVKALALIYRTIKSSRTWVSRRGKLGVNRPLTFPNMADLWKAFEGVEVNYGDLVSVKGYYSNFTQLRLNIPSNHDAAFKVWQETFDQLFHRKTMSHMNSGRAMLREWAEDWVIINKARFKAHAPCRLGEVRGTFCCGVYYNNWTWPEFFCPVFIQKNLYLASPSFRRTGYSEVTGRLVPIPEDWKSVIRVEGNVFGIDISDNRRRAFPDRVHEIEKPQSFEANIWGLFRTLDHSMNPLFEYPMFGVGDLISDLEKAAWEIIFFATEVAKGLGHPMVEVMFYADQLHKPAWANKQAVEPLDVWASIDGKVEASKHGHVIRV